LRSLGGDDDAVLACGLGLVEGSIRRGDELVGVERAPRARCNSEAGRHPNRAGAVAHRDLGLDPGSNPLGDLQRAGNCRLGQRDDELLSAVTGRNVYSPGLVGENRAHRAQDGVALEMAEGVVDVLEVVDVGDYERQRMPETRRPRRLVVHHFTKGPLVGQAREVIGHRLLRNELVQGDVLDRRCSLTEQIQEHRALVAVEGSTRPGDGKHADALV
jgi:hypothetical protein